MNPGRILKLLTMLLVASTPAMAQQKPPTEAQCRDVVNGMLQAMKSAQMKSERDKQGAQVVIDRAEKIVRDNRARGASECESWAAIGNLVTNQ